MQLDKGQIIDLLRSQGDTAKADQAERDLPGQVDTNQHGDLLSQLGLDPQKLLGLLGKNGGGGLGGLLGR